MTKMNPVVHFEMPYENRERLVKFYTQAFALYSITSLCFM